jgi:hypothetical protein
MSGPSVIPAKAGTSAKMRPCQKGRHPGLRRGDALWGAS